MTTQQRTSSVTKTVTDQTTHTNHHIVPLNGIFESVNRGLQTVLEVDLQATTWLYQAAKGNDLVDHCAKLASFTCDEVLWFFVPCVVPTLLWLAKGALYTPFIANVTCEEEALLDLFGAVTTCAFVEQICKSLFRRARPTMRDHNGPWAVWGEWWSFPSGHTLRAFYLHVYFHKSAVFRTAFLPAATEWGFGEFAMLSLTWCAVVGWARVAVGRHHVLDVLVGALVGYALGTWVEAELSFWTRGLVKIMSGVVVATQAWYLLVSTILRSMVFMNPKTQARNMVLAKVIFFGIYVTALLAGGWYPYVMSPTPGRLSIVPSLTSPTQWECKRSLHTILWDWTLTVL